MIPATGNTLNSDNFWNNHARETQPQKNSISKKQNNAVLFSESTKKANNDADILIPDELSAEIFLSDIDNNDSNLHDSKLSLLDELCFDINNLCQEIENNLIPTKKSIFIKNFKF